MASNKKTAKKDFSVLIENCNVTGQESTNEHTRAAVVALATALSDNSRAIIAVAKALEGPTNCSTGIVLNAPKE